MEQYLARLCWNSKGWTRPTGEAAELETGSYAEEMGFGHEEWLFDPSALLDGWQYGFLQPVSKSRDRLAGQVIDVRLFTIGPGGKWLYVGRLPECEVLTHDAAEEARRRYRESGRAEEMKTQLDALGADSKGLLLEDPRWLVNVRFRPGSAERYEPLVAVGPKDPIRKLPRYVLVSLEDKWSGVADGWPTAKRLRPLATTTVWPDDVPSGQKYTEGATKTVTVNAYERDPRSREICLAHHGNACCVCGMSFRSVYGEDFEDMTVHVHHLVPIAARGGEYEVDPREDLRPVCPNCHAVMHRKTPPYTPDEVKRLLRIAPR